MYYIIVAAFLMFVIALVHLCFSFYNQKKTFEDQIEVLEGIITMLEEKQLTQQKKLQLSDALHNQLKQANTALRASIVDLNADLFENVFNKKA